METPWLPAVPTATLVADDGLEAGDGSAVRPWSPRALMRGCARGVSAAGRAVIDLALPPCCLACRRRVADPDSLCARCWSAMQFIERPFCEILGIPFAFDLGPGVLSAEAIADPPGYDRARAAVLFDDASRPLVHGLKYRDRQEAARLMGRLMARAGHEILAEADLIVPVPLHRSRLWRRRFNQAAVLADHVSRLSGIASDPFALARIRATARQVGLDLGARALNGRGAFAVPVAAKARVSGRRVVLVDDVLTSGATVEAATRTLRRAGARHVDILVFARVVKGEANPI